MILKIINNYHPKYIVVQFTILVRLKERGTLTFKMCI